MLDDKKDRERQILECVYCCDSFADVKACETPDFQLRHAPDDAWFGVEITEFFPTETDARILRNPEYIQDLIDGKDFRHKADRRVLDVTTVDVLDKERQIKARGMKCVIHRGIPSLSECAGRLADLIDQKSAKFRRHNRSVTHVNLLIQDNSERLGRVPIEYFYNVIFVDEVRAALSQSPFREVMFITEMDGRKIYFALNLLHVLSELTFFCGFDDVDCELAFDSADEALEVFASYFSQQVKRDVWLRWSDSGTEVIYGDTAVSIQPETIQLIIRSDLPLPADCHLADFCRAEKLLGADFPQRLVQFRSGRILHCEAACFPVLNCDVTDQ